MYKINEQKLAEYITNMKQIKMYNNAMKLVEEQDTSRIKNIDGYWLWKIIK
jgi:hypothetical protein